MSLPYLYTPRPGESISVARDGQDYCILGACEERSGRTAFVRVLPEEVPAVAAGIAIAMHEAAGLPAPVILERPTPRKNLVPIPGDRSLVEVGTTLNSAVLTSRVVLRVGPEDGHCAYVTLAGDEPLRIALALVDATKEGAASEPGPAEVEDLACVIARYRKTTVSDGHDHGIARAVLRHQRDKQQRGERP